MGTLITYRDLPGGPMKIKFADEISRHCLCRKCHMLSLRMYSDSATHMFCDDCLNDQSYKHKKYEIYCPDERKDVSLAEMYQARGLVTILFDQYVECPNQPKCTLKLPLGQLEKHYIECKEMSSIKCTKCGHKVQSTSWMQHKTDCQPACDNELPRKKADHRDGKRKPPPASSARLPVSTSTKNGSAKDTTAAPSALYPSNLLPDAATGEFNQQFQSLGSASTSTQQPVKSQGPAAIDPEKTKCKHCGRNVKEWNMPQHLKVCYDVRAPCPYCDENVARKDMKAHAEECKRKFEEACKASDAAAAASGNSKKNKKTKVAPREPHENPPHLRNNSNAKKKSNASMTLEAKGTSAETTSHTEQELQLCSGWSTDVTAWLPYATAENWYAAYVAMEEQFKDTGTDQAARHTHFVPKLVALKQDHFVRDFIDAPYEPQPFDCLITALFVRACLPFNVWAQRSKVTWQDVLKYLPMVLHSRLGVGAKLYLQKHPVILEDNGYRMVDEVGTVAANALIPGHMPLVSSSDAVTAETEALDVPEVDMRDVAGAQKQELGPPQVLGKKEEAQHSKKTRKLSIADLLDDITSTLGAIGIHEIFPEIDFEGEGGCVKTRDQTQRDLSVEGTYWGQGDDADRHASGLVNGLVVSEQESYTTYQNTSPSHHLGPSADEPMKYLAATKASSHSTEVEQPYPLTYAEAGKVPNRMPTATGAFDHDREDGQKSCHQERGTYEASDTCSYKTRSSICEDKPPYSVVAEGRMNPRSGTGHMTGEVPSSHQPNEGFSSETTKEESKQEYVTGSPVLGSFSEEVPPPLLNLQHEQNESVQADDLGSGNTKYEMSRGISSQNSRIEHFREKGGYAKTHEQTQQELSEGTYERQCDETERPVSGLGSGLVSSEQKSNTAFQNATPPHPSGRSADEPTQYIAATNASSHSTRGKKPCRMTCADALEESIPTTGTSGAFNDDPDDGQESCHLKSGSYEIDEACSYKTRSSIYEGKPAYYSPAEDSNINPRGIAGHLAGGVPSTHPPNQIFCFETTKEDSKPNHFTGSPVSGSFNEEIPPTLLNAQHEQNEIIQVDALGSANTKYEVSGGISSQNSRIGHFREKSGCVKTHDQTQQELSEGTNERQCDETERSVSGLDGDLVSSERKSDTAFQNSTPSHPSGPSADEPTQYLAATKASSHSTGGKKPFLKTSADALEESIPTRGTSGAFNDDPDDDQESCHLKSGSYELNEACSYKTRSSICEGKPAYYAAAKDSNINPRSIAGHLAGGVPSSHQQNQSFCFETTKEGSKPNRFTGSPVSGSFNEEISPTLLNAQHEQNEIIQADAPGSSNTKYEMSQGISSRNSRIEHFREKGGCVKSHDQSQELSEGTNARQCDETERSVSGLGSGLVFSEEKSYTAFQNTTPSHHSGPSADEPMKYPAATKASSHSSGEKHPYRMTCAEAIKESNQAPATTGAFNDDPDDGQESCHLKSGGYEESDTCFYKTRNSICEGKPAYCASAEDSNINPRSFAGHLAVGVPSSHQPNKGVSFKTTKEDSKPNHLTGSPVFGSFNEEVPPALLNAQHEQNEIIQADAPGSSNTKYEMSRGISSQNSRIEHFREKGGCVKTHDQTQQELSEGTNERQCDETERSVSGLGSGLISYEQENNTAFQNATPSHHLGPSVDEPVKCLATAKASSHSIGDKEPRRITFAEVVKKSYATPAATAAFVHDLDGGQESCHEKYESYEVNESHAYKKGQSNISEDKPAHSVVSEDRKIFSNVIAGHIGGGTLLCGQLNKGFSTETTDEDSKRNCVTGSPLPCRSSGEVPPAPLNLQHQQNEILQADALRSSTAMYEWSRGRSSQNARIVWNSSMTQKYDNIGVRKEGRAELTNTDTRCTARKAVTSFSHPETTEKSPVGTFSTANVNLEMKSSERHRTADFPKRSDFHSCASCKDSWGENDDHLKPKASKHCYESRSNNQKPSQGSRNRCQNSEISQACDEDQAKVEKIVSSETDTTATVQDSTHQKNGVDSTAPAPEFEALTYDQMKTKVTVRRKFQTDIPCSLQPTCEGDTFAVLHRADTVQRSSQELYSQTVDSSMNACRLSLEQAEESVDDVSNNQESLFSEWLSSMETEV